MNLFSIRISNPSIYYIFEADSQSDTTTKHYQNIFFQDNKNVSNDEHGQLKIDF